MTRTAIVIGALLIVCLSFSCSRYVDSTDPVRSLPEAPPVPSSVLAQLNSRSVTLSWEVPNGSAVSQYRVYYTTDTTAGFAVKDSTTERSIVIGGLALNREYFFQVAAVDGNGLEGERSITVSAVTALLSLTVNGNDQYTNSRDVSVQLIANNAASHVYLSEDSTFDDAIAQSFSSQRSFTLSSGDGIKRVYGRFIFLDGSESQQPLSDSIILDTRAQIDSVWYLPTGVSTFSAGDTIQFFVDAAEVDGEADISLTGLDPIRLFDDGTNGDQDAADGVYSAEWIVPGDVTLNSGSVVGEFTDAAGNDADLLSSLTLTIFSAPLPVQLTLVESLSSYEVSLTWSQAASADFASYRIYRSESNTVGDADDLLTTITSRSTVTYTDTTVDANTDYYYRVYVRNSLGMTAPSNIDSVTTPTNSPPGAVVLAGALSDATTVRLTWTANGDHDFQSYRIYRSSSSTVDDSDQLVDIITSRSTTSTTHGLTANRWYRVYVYDKQGLSTGSNAIQITN
ncbi:fibronectin type III domain-containing protein [bacterium]|nr:fibronectin type III domain-containing protein [bacterium]MCB2202218.1 fibronectin type III domain-containing protein [bacterium]